MEYTTLGDSGLSVSRICLGCMSFGSGRDWTLDAEESRDVIERAIELGIAFFDTANVYSAGEAESILGDVLAEYDRDRMVVGTKGRFPVGADHPNAGGLSRKSLEAQLEASLDRLDMDAVDLYQIHRWDDETPIEETLRTLDDAVRRGQTKYIGASSMWAYQFADSLSTSERLGLESFVSMTNHYNLAHREEEREMLPLCAEKGVGVIPWSPLARGFLTRPHEEYTATTRGQEEAEGYDHPFAEGGGREINERVQELADEHDASMAQIALAWLLGRDWVDAPIIGTSSIDHLEEAVDALEISLSDSDMAYLEAPYEAGPVYSHAGRY